VLPLILVPPAKRRKRGTKASSKTSATRAPRSASVRGRGRKSTKVVADRLLVDVEMGGPSELPLLIKQSFRDGRYSPSMIRMEELEWQIMQQQFIVSWVVVKDEIVNIDSD
jgi:hypothetical protein